MKQPSWSLENAIEIQKEAPYTFYRPSEAIIDRLKPEEATVKLIFSFDSDEPNVPAAERMWVIVNSINEDGSYTGTLDNDPFHIKDLKAGDKVIFKREHIIDYDTLKKLDIEDENLGKLEKYFKKCFVSNQIMHDGYKVGRLYREESDDEEYSGWTLMSDYESQEYVDDYNNLQYIAIGVVLNKDDSFIHLLDSPVASDFARDEVTNIFYQIE